MKRTRRKWLSVLQVLALCASIHADRANGEGTPGVVESIVKDYVGPTLWVSAKVAGHADSILDWELLGVTRESSLGKMVERQREQVTQRAHSSVPATKAVRQVAESDCTSTIVTTADYGGGDKPSGSFHDLLRHSLGIYAGTIAAIEPGFAGGVPASLLKIDIREVLRSSDEYPKSGAIYVLHPLARFSIGDYVFCGGVSNSTFNPTIGDHVLLFAYTAPIGRGIPLAAPRSEQIFFETADGSLFLPPKLRPDPALRAIENLERIKGMVRRLETERLTTEIDSSAIGE